MLVSRDSLKGGVEEGRGGDPGGSGMSEVHIAAAGLERIVRSVLLRLTMFYYLFNTFYDFVFHQK